MHFVNIQKNNKSVTDERKMYNFKMHDDDNCMHLDFIDAIFTF